MPELTPLADERIEGTTWKPTPGGRVTLLYPEDFTRGHPNMPERVVGTITKIEPCGTFYVVVQPTCHTIVVDPRNYATYGATIRGWKVKDGWQATKTVKNKNDGRGRKK